MLRFNLSGVNPSKTFDTVPSSVSLTNIRQCSFDSWSMKKWFWTTNSTPSPSNSQRPHDTQLCPYKVAHRCTNIWRFCRRRSPSGFAVGLWNNPWAERMLWEWWGFCASGVYRFKEWSRNDRSFVGISLYLEIAIAGSKPRFEVYLTDSSAIIYLDGLPVCCTCENMQFYVGSWLSPEASAYKLPVSCYFHWCF